MKLGVSVYPEQETLEQIDAYLGMAAKYGFTKVFTSMFSVEGTKEEIITYFKDFSAIAHKYGMVVSGDCNGEFFGRMGATETDLSVFKEMGIDIIRMDFSFNDERDAILINNKDGILIEMSTGFVPVIEAALANGANPKNISTCHNFFPERYTAPTLEAIYNLNEYWHKKGITVAIFVSSQVPGTHGPWPVSHGLPTIEEHRNMPIEAQVKQIMAFKNVDEILIGNAFASEDEFKAIAAVMEKAYINVPLNPALGAFAEFMPHGDLQRIPFKVKLDSGVTPLEKEIAFDYPTHNDMDCLNYCIRSRFTRVVYKAKDIPVRPCDKKYFTKGDVVIVNDNCKHYHGEVQIVLKDMEVDGERNLIGRIVDEEIPTLDFIGAGDIFTFME